MGFWELAHTLCPAPVSALHLTQPERDRKRERKVLREREQEGGRKTRLIKKKENKNAKANNKRG